MLNDKKKPKKLNKAKKAAKKQEVDLESLENGKTEVDTVNNSR